MDKLWECPCCDQLNEDCTACILCGSQQDAPTNDDQDNEIALARAERTMTEADDKVALDELWECPCCEEINETMTVCVLCGFDPNAPDTDPPDNDDRPDAGACTASRNTYPVAANPDTDWVSEFLECRRQSLDTGDPWPLEVGHAMCQMFPGLFMKKIQHGYFSKRLGTASQRAIFLRHFLARFPQGALAGPLLVWARSAAKGPKIRWGDFLCLGGRAGSSKLSNSIAA
jgi:hypothetical protein